MDQPGTDQKGTKPPAAEVAPGKFDELDAVDKMLVRALMRNPSETNTELGKLVGLKRKAVAVRRERPPVKEALTELLLPARTILDKKAGPLTRKAVEMAEGGDARVLCELIRVIFPKRLEVDHTGALKVEYGSLAKDDPAAK